LSVELNPSLLIVPTSAQSAEQRVFVQLTNNARGEMAGQLKLSSTFSENLTDTLLRAQPTAAPFTLKSQGVRITKSLTVRFNVQEHSVSGYDLIGAQAVTNKSNPFTLTERTISYPHIQTHRIYTPAKATARRFDLKVAPVRVGYIMGSGDEIPQAIERMGLPVTLLNEQDLATGDLTRFDTIVVGIRASQTRPDFVANSQRLLEFMQQGGALIVQYQRPDYAKQNLPPFPAEQEVKTENGQTTIARVVDETAPVVVLQPTHPAFNFPNKITLTDWQGWVQERNLYSFTSFDSRYTPLLESHDANESPQTGGEVYARVGRGHYVYTSYAWFRQLPAGVPGAYRLFANLLSLPKSGK